MSDGLKNKVKRLHLEIIGERHYDDLDQVLTEKFTYRNSFVNQVKDRSWFNNFLLDLERAFPDYSLPIEEIQIEEDMVICRYTFIGTHKSAFLKIPATGMHVTIPCISEFKFDGELINSINTRIDMAAVRRYMAQGVKRALARLGKNKSAAQE